ncbi:MAG: hypothetical protein IKT95_00910 [Spirochaetales bacterium]|nr:hypothetical protein [Spirochaetales bacterium]
MFENIGGKIKGLAKVICWIGIICCVIIGIIAISEDDGLAGVIIIVAGSLLSWVGSFVLYGFGELVENSSAIRSDLSQMKERTDR